MLTLDFIFFCKGEFDKQEIELLSVYCIKVAGVILLQHIRGV